MGKATEEIGEFAREVNERFSDPSDYQGNGARMEQEAADLVLVVMALVGRWGNGTDVLDLVEAKLARLNDPMSGHRAALRPYENPEWNRVVVPLGETR